MSLVEAVAQITEVSLPASLYANCGKLLVHITRLGDDCAMVMSQTRPASGSIAILVRNGVKVPTRIAWGEDDLLALQFEEPLITRRHAAFSTGYRAAAAV